MKISQSTHIKVDKVMDYVPVASTVSNLIDLVQKKRFNNAEEKTFQTWFKCTRNNDRQLFKDLQNYDDSRQDRSKVTYKKHIKEKSTTRMVVGLVPVIGNLALGIFDITTKATHYFSKEEQFKRIHKESHNLSIPIIYSKITINSRDPEEIRQTLLKMEEIIKKEVAILSKLKPEELKNGKYKPFVDSLNYYRTILEKSTLPQEEKDRGINAIRGIVNTSKISSFYKDYLRAVKNQHTQKRLKDGIDTFFNTPNTQPLT